MQRNLCMKSFITKVQHQNTKNQTVILTYKMYFTYLVICCDFYLENDDIGFNAAIIRKYQETTHASEQREWNDEII